MLAEMTAAQLDDWTMIYQLNPWGDARADWHAARIAWAALQPHSKRRLRETDLLLKFRTSTVSPASNYRQKAAQRYGMIAAGFDRRERDDNGQAD